MEECGPHALLSDKTFLLDYLAKNNLALFWTILSEKQIIPRDFSSGHRYTDYSRAYMLAGGEKIISSEPIINSVKHGNTEPK